MKLSILATGMTLLVTATLAQTPTAKEEGISAIKMLGGTLKSELQTKMKEDPTAVVAAGFCQGSATAMTQDVNSKLPQHINVRRTALKLRNPKNSADALDIEVMKGYDEAVKMKTFGPKSAIRVVEDGDTTRVYKPLLIEAACLKCHGSNISPQITQLIKDGYPDDMAVGFKEGDFRGVIVAEVKKN